MYLQKKKTYLLIILFSAVTSAANAQSVAPGDTIIRKESILKRVSPEIHSAIAMLAQEAGITLNAFIRQVLAREVKVVI